MTVNMKIDLIGPGRRGFALGINETAGYLGVAVTALATGYLATGFGPPDWPSSPPGSPMRWPPGWPAHSSSAWAPPWSTRRFQPVMLQPERLRRPRPADHRLCVVAHRAEQAVLKIPASGCAPTARPTRDAQCWRPQPPSPSSCSRTPQRLETVAFPRMHPQPRHTAPAAPCAPSSILPAQIPRRNRSYTPICHDTPAKSGISRFIQESGISEGAAPGSPGAAPAARCPWTDQTGPVRPAARISTLPSDRRAMSASRWLQPRY